jgi:hypothetical protein
MQGFCSRERTDLYVRTPHPVAARKRIRSAVDVTKEAAGPKGTEIDLPRKLVGGRLLGNRLGGTDTVARMFELYGALKSQSGRTPPDNIG